MKGSILKYAFVATVLISSCTGNEIDNAPATPLAARRISATIEPADYQPDSKTYVNDELRVLWHAGDEINLFNYTSASSRYIFEGATGDCGGSFSYVSGDSSYGGTLNNIFAVYPYNDETAINNWGVIQLNLPHTQTYASGSFGPGANTMVAKYDNNVLLFRNLCGYLTFSVKGDGCEVSSLILHGNDDECVSGWARASFGQDGIPVIESINTGDTSAEIVLECPEPVAVGSGGKDFWFVVPPMNFSKGFSLLVKLKDGTLYKKSVATDVSIQRNKRIRVAPLDLNEQTPLYSSNDGIVSIHVKTAGTLNARLKEAKAAIGGTITSLRVTGSLNDSDLDAIYYLNSVKSLDLRGAEIPAGINYIYDNTLEYLYLPDSMTELGSNALSNNSKLKYVYGKNITKLCYKSLAGCKALEDYYLPEVTDIESRAFDCCESLTTLDFPKATNIEASAFSDCVSVSTVSLASLKELKNGVFSWYAPFNIESISLPNLVKVEDSAFRGQQKLKSINLPSLQELGKHILAESSVEEIIFHSLKKIPEYAFSGNTTLRRVYGKKVKWVGQGAFQGCERLKDVSLPDADTFEAQAFYGCTLGGDLEFYSLQYIGDNCFEQSSGLGSSIVLLPLALYIGNSAFANCTSLVAIEIPLALSLGANAFYGCKKLISINGDNTLIATSIGDYAFGNCTALGRLDFPNLTNMGSLCFSGSGLRSLAFGCLPWKKVDDFGWPVAPFEFWQFPIGEESLKINLRINSVELPPVADEDHPWWQEFTDEEGRKYYTFLRKRWASVDTY